MTSPPARLLQELDVSSSEADAFSEYYAAKQAAADREPISDELRSWKEDLAATPAEVTVRAFLARPENERQLRAACDGTVPKKLVEKAIFTAVYGKKASSPLPLNKALARVLAEHTEAKVGGAHNAKERFECTLSRFESEHATLRLKAFPYRPACGSSTGSTTIDCLLTGGSGKPELLGYIACGSDGYIDDLSVLPACQGCGIARKLVVAAAAQLAAACRPEISLHVRACNYPAIALYTSLGFGCGELEFPPWYDWHGGYHMSAKAAAVAAAGSQHAPSHPAAATPPPAAALPAFVSPFGTVSAAERGSIPQTGASNCGATAVVTQLQALGLRADPNGEVVVRARDYATPSLATYLQSRSRAGCTADDLVRGTTSLSGGKAIARFFATGPERPAGLCTWLGEWMVGGDCVAIATINTQLDGADYWHHQAVLGVWPAGCRVLLANPCGDEPEDELARLLGSGSEMLIMGHDVSQRCAGRTDGAMAQEYQQMRQDPAWANVPAQVERMRKGGSGDGADGKLLIPASYTPGLTLIARTGSEAAKRLGTAQNPWRLA